MGGDYELFTNEDLPEVFCQPVPRIRHRFAFGGCSDISGDRRWNGKRQVLVLVLGVLMIENINQERLTAWVIFKGGEHRNFWRIFTRRGWRHCYVVIPAYDPAPGLNADCHSIIVEPSTNHVNIGIHWRSPSDVVERVLSDGATCVMKFHVDRRKNRSYVPRGPITCVTLAKAVLGVNAWHVWTPEQLARWIARNGGVMVTKETEVC